MEELEILLGQRALPSVYGDQTTATAYAGLGTRHVLVLADGSAGEVGSRLAAQTAASCAMARIRGSVLPDLGMTLEEAIGEAHQATTRVLLGTGLEQKSGASLLVVVLDASGLVAARVGGGRVYLLRGDRLDALYSSAGPEILGVGDVEPEIVISSIVLGIGDRILILSEAAARPLAADLERLGRGGPPQLAASRLADAARRRGQLDPVSVHIIDIAGDSPRTGPHPALARIARERADTFDPDGRLLGRQRRTERHGPTSGGSGTDGPGLGILAGLGAVLGALLAFVIHGNDTPAVVQAPRAAVIVDVEPEPAETVPDVVEVAAPAPVEVAPELVELFAPDTPRGVARNIRNYVTRRFPEDGDAVFVRLEEAIIARGTEPKVIEALLELMREPELKRTAKWVQELLPRLYAKAGGDAAP
jgi:hypothetical protein